MKRFFIAVSCLLLITASGIFAQDDPQTLVLPTGTMTLTAPENSEREPRLSPVLFPHSLHFSYSCKDCHHEWDGANAVKSCSTAGCHENLWAAMPGTLPLDARRTKSLTGAYHQVCRSCHRREAAMDMSTGPIACDGCHPTPHSDIENSEDTMTIPLGNLTIKAPEGVEAKRGEVAFPHGLHFQFSCQDCHHDWDGESEVTSCMAAGCHDETEPSGKRDINDPDNVLYYLAAYHNACVGCHRDLEKERKTQEKQVEAELAKGIKVSVEPVKSGPVGCTGCHS